MSSTSNPQPHEKACEADKNGHANWLIDRIKTFFEAEDLVRRGVCLLNAGAYDAAEGVFQEAVAKSGGVDGEGTAPVIGPHADRLKIGQRRSPASLAAYLAACLIGRGKAEAAAEKFDQAAAGEAGWIESIRRGHSLALAGREAEAIATLREAVGRWPECAELHFQLGTLLTQLGLYEEAELRFTQALNIDRDHVDARVSLSLCFAIRQAPGEALAQLQRAQALRPYDAGIGLLLAQASRAARQQGLSDAPRAAMPEAASPDRSEDIDELSRVIAGEPDFVDAFLAIPLGSVDEQVYAMLLRTIEVALERQPEQAELHYHCGRVLERLGRDQEAIRENERAVAIDPTFIRALIELGKLYQKTDRSVDATRRLEQAVAAGAQYADVYCLLGNLYRDRGETGRARSAYRRALVLNGRYEAAMEALAGLGN